MPQAITEQLSREQQIAALEKDWATNPRWKGTVSYTHLDVYKRQVNTEEKVLNIYNWPDYVPAGMIATFEKESGIKVNYDTFETNEALHAKLVAGNSGYDIVVPGSVFAKPQIEGGMFQPLAKDKSPNLANLDPAIMATLAKNTDPDNKYLVPWGWGFTLSLIHI